MDFEFSGGQNTRKWNSEVINLIFNGLTYSVSANFLNAHIFSVNYIFFANVKTVQFTKYLHILCVKPSSIMYILCFL